MLFHLTVIPQSPKSPVSREAGPGFSKPWIWPWLMVNTSNSPLFHHLCIAICTVWTHKCMFPHTCSHLIPMANVASFHEAASSMLRCLVKKLPGPSRSFLGWPRGFPPQQELVQLCSMGMSSDLPAPTRREEGISAAKGRKSHPSAACEHPGILKDFQVSNNPNLAHETEACNPQAIWAQQVGSGGSFPGVMGPERYLQAASCRSPLFMGHESLCSSLALMFLTFLL